MAQILLEHAVLITMIISIWTLPWTGWALWLAARRREKWWFIALLLTNTLAILEIVYIFAIAKRSDREVVEVHAPSSEE